MSLADPPSYLGSSGGSACDKDYRTIGFAPTTAGRHPLFLYYVGTQIVSADESSRYDSQATLKVTEAMARRGFVALSVEYPNQLANLLANKLDCLYDKNKAGSLLTKACAMPQVDCALGIATWGHSQGALLAHSAARYETRVRAVWTTGYGGIDNPALPYDRLRVVNGEADTMNSQVATLNKTTGFTSAECPDDGRDKCLRADGSGWIVVRKAACATNSADHCWFDKRNCGQNGLNLEPNWVDPSSSALFALEANADWVAQTLARK